MSSNRSAHDRLLALQKKIHRSLQQQAMRLMGEMPESIRRYEREYREDFKRIPRRPQLADKGELIQEIRKADVTLIGDYHTFAQAQRTALRILRESVQKGESWYLGLEMFPSHKQDALDRFQLGQVSEAHFLKEIGYEEEWGFPWRHYAPIIHWAIRNRVKLVALNRPSILRQTHEADENELYERDRWAAGIITDTFHAAREAHVKRPRMIVLFGELHIGKKHLPQTIKDVSTSTLNRSLRTLILHQNQDDLYWKMASQGRELEAQVIRLRQRSYCVLSSPPWAKWQSVINWAEGAHASPASLSGGKFANPYESDYEDDCEDDSEDEEPIDPLSLMTQYAAIVSEFFGIPKPSFDELDVYTIRNADFSENLKDSHLSPIEKRLIRYHVLHHHRVYIPSAPLAYLAAPNENGAAEIASIHLFRTALASSSSQNPSAPKQLEQKAASFYQWILDHAFGFFGSLVLNPRRKCDLIADHEQRILELKKGAKASYPHEKAARELAYQILSSAIEEGSGEPPEALIFYLKNPGLAPALFFAARYVGFALAKQVHHALLQEKTSLNQLKRVFFGDPDTSLPPSYWRFHSLKSTALKGPIAASKTESL
ncbi:MAG: ChaN family lipoprotein [Bdellovibrionia bacterium]